MRPDELERAVLEPHQREFLEALVASALAGSFYLTGGTALAGFYLHHRHSEDLDLFSDEEVPLTAIESFLAALPGARVGSSQRLFDRRIFLLDMKGRRLKVEFALFPFTRMTPLQRLATGLNLDSILEIYVNKVHAATDRREPKDDVDLYFLLRTPGLPPLREAVTLAERKFGIKGVGYSLQRRLLQRPGELPPTIPPVTSAEVARCFREEAETLVAGSIEE